MWCFLRSDISSVTEGRRVEWTKVPMIGVPSGSRTTVGGIWQLMRDEVVEHVYFSLNLVGGGVQLHIDRLFFVNCHQVTNVKVFLDSQQRLLPHLWKTTYEQQSIPNSKTNKQKWYICNIHMFIRTSIYPQFVVVWNGRLTLRNESIGLCQLFSLKGHSKMTMVCYHLIIYVRSS